MTTKFNLWIVLWVVVFVACLFSPKIVQGDLLVNPGFEDGLNGWTAMGNAAIRPGDPPPFEGLA